MEDFEVDPYFLEQITNNKQYIGPQIDTLGVKLIYNTLSLEKIILPIKCKTKADCI